MILILKARTRALEREHNGRAWAAWHTAALGRVDRLPRLESLLKTRTPTRAPQQSWQQQLAIAMQWNAEINRRQKPRRTV